VEDQFERTEKLIGGEALKRLAASKVAVFGIGGVGGACAEALARMGIGSIDLYDNDVVTLTNVNRQIVALHSTIGRKKTEVMAERIKDINPSCEVGVFSVFYSPETAGGIDISGYSYIVDAIDTVSGKVELVSQAKAAGVMIVCAMGAGNRMDPTKFIVTDIHKTEMDPLAKAVRKELRSRGIKDVKVVCSTEPPRDCGRVPASNSFVPPAMGLILASEVIKDLI